MRIVEIREAADLEGLRRPWETLLTQSGSDTIFVTWEWMSAWWKAYGVPGELRILAVYDDAGRLRGIAPLRETTLKGYGQSVRALQFVGYAVDDCDSDYLDVIAARGYEQAVMEALRGYLSEAIKSGTVLRLNEVPETSPNLQALDAMASAMSLERIDTPVDCSTVKLPETWEDYLAMLKPRFRTKVRSVLRNLESRDDVSFHFCRSLEDVERLLPVLYDLHQRRWRAEGKPGVFGDARKREFYRTVSALLLDRGWLRFSWLEWKGRILACQYGFAYQGVYFQLQEGYEPASEHWNIGVGLRAWTIREFLKEGLREYDFMAGTGRHKSDWGSEIKRNKRILLARVTPGNVLFFRGPQWEAEARKAVIQIVPSQVLEARQTAGAISDSHSQSGWMRQAAAKAYCRFGLPLISRRLRDRYEFTMTPNGRFPKGTWKRRTGPSARIFCYHRVNDEGDPFFDATSTALFEEHVRFLARHYRVVGLSEMVRHLEEERSTEPVVALTFDDGYRDNFENAFPILQRYGVPATIFLTTGSLDSGEPLWFERLAEAVKHTKLEYLDTEFDIPRRFVMRTAEERVAASRGIFGCLRLLGNAKRLELLEDILRKLGAGSPVERRNKMLKWDEVRLMGANRIEFGGHTVTHPFLSKLQPDQAAWEVSECKRRIEQELQTAVEFFAYPNGQGEDFAPSNKELLRSAGYRGAVTTLWGMNYQSTDRMEMRRGGPWEHNAALFACKLDWYQLTNQ